MSNLHTLRLDVDPDGERATAHCTICPSFTLRLSSYRASGGREYAEGAFKRHHSAEYEPGRAPSISVDWEPSAWCSICNKSDIVADAWSDDGGVICEHCGTRWDGSGGSGETDEGRLAELFDEAWDYWHVWGTAGRDSAGNIRMRSGAGTLVARAEDPRHAIEGWLSHARVGGDYWIQYRAALDLLDREAAAE